MTNHYVIGDKSNINYFIKREEYPTKKKTTIIDFYSNYAEIIIKDKYKVKIDLEDVDKIKNYSWCLIEETYCASLINKKVVRLARFLLNAQKGEIVDHISHDTLDNRRRNIRKCTKQQNAYNAKISCRNKSGYKGVSWDSSRKLWAVRMKINNKYAFLGRFSKIEEAVKQRNLYEDKIQGEFKYVG